MIAKDELIVIEKYINDALLAAKSFKAGAPLISALSNAKIICHQNLRSLRESED
jgi:hypothetical protein